MSHCCECRYWESSDLNTEDGMAICLKLTEETTVAGAKRKLGIK